MAKSLQPVQSYLWSLDLLDPTHAQALKEEGTDFFNVPAWDYWPPFPEFEVEDGRRFIVVAEEFKGVTEPNHELLECGHIKPMRKYNGRQYYNRRRVCRICATGVPQL